MEQPQLQPLLLAQHLRGAAHECELLGNLPAITDAQMLRNIMNAVNGISDRLTAIDVRMEALEVKMEAPTFGMQATDNNSQARLYNSELSSSQQALEPIRTSANVEPVGFPLNSSQISFLTDAQLDALFAAYSRHANGNVNAKRKRFRRLVGLMRDV